MSTLRKSFVYNVDNVAPLVNSVCMLSSHYALMKTGHSKYTTILTYFVEDIVCILLLKLSRRSDMFIGVILQ